MKSKIRRGAGKVMQVCAIVVCVVLAFRGHPPAGAQVKTQFVPVLTVKDAQQDDAIENLRQLADKSEHTTQQRIDETRSTLQQQSDDLKRLRDDVAGLKGENRAEFAGIALLGGGGMVLSRRRKREEE